MPLLENVVWNSVFDFAMQQKTVITFKKAIQIFLKRLLAVIEISTSSHLKKNSSHFRYTSSMNIDCYFDSYKLSSVIDFFIFYF